MLAKLQRLPIVRRLLVAFLAALSLLATGVALTACSTDQTALGQIAPGQTVFADLWDEDGDKGDQALVEQKPSGMWIVDVSVHFASSRKGGFDVEVRLDAESGTFVVVDMGSTKVGKDHDDCLSVSDDDHEHYIVMLDTSLNWESDGGGSNDDDDCYVLPED